MNKQNIPMQPTHEGSSIPKLGEPNVRMQTARVVKTIDETEKVKTIELGCALVDAIPGQFIMVWLPGIGERPMSIVNNDPLTISISNVGKVSSELYKVNKGDLVSFRGPFGNGFSHVEGKGRILLVGGGYGVAPLYFLAKRASKTGHAVEVVVGARNKKEVMFEKRLYVVAAEVFVTTDDGSQGRKGTVIDEIKELVGKKEFDCVYACGPEKMLKAVGEVCRDNKLKCQLSLERYMKCGFGVCGSCDIEGKLVCKDGPVFEGAEVLKFGEFGKCHRDASGSMKKM